ncbi:MAG: hypothetical protein LC631_03150, partial [Desulfovibrionales bacterium]|nr:hypothetical protein [Desulfovibrionales bacterium]
MSQKTVSKKRVRKKQQVKKKILRTKITPARTEKSIFYFYEAIRFKDQKNYEKALTFLRKAIRFDPDNSDAMREMIILGVETENDEAYFEGFLQYYESGLMPNDSKSTEALLELSIYLAHQEKYSKALEIAQDIKDRFESLDLRNRGKFRKRLMNHIGYLEYKLSNYVIPKQQGINKTQKKTSERNPQKKQTAASRSGVKESRSSPDSSGSGPEETMHSSASQSPGFSSINETLAEIPVVLNVNGGEIASDLANATSASIEEYNLVLDAIRLRFKETFDHLLCLGSLDGITSMAYQEETARKVLKTFRGRALMADEVGMGKTIEACMVIKEYLMRGMVKNILVLTPTPLVSQWCQELGSKFALDFRSTDDPDFRGQESKFWNAPRIVASINTAKSKKHFSSVTSRE